MEILVTNDGILCNSEVTSIIQERRHARSLLQQKRKDSQKDSNNSNSSNTSSSRSDEASASFQNRDVLEMQILNNQSMKSTQSSSNVSEFISTLRSNGITDITKAEYLQIFNLLPTTAVEIHLILEECSVRLSEEQVEFILSNIASLLSKN